MLETLNAIRYTVRWVSVAHAAHPLWRLADGTLMVLSLFVLGTHAPQGRHNDRAHTGTKTSAIT